MSSSSVLHSRVLLLNGSTWEVCRDVAQTNCMDATIADAEGQTVYLFGYKLLTAFPNHTYSERQSYHTEQHNHDGANWCVACHADNDIDPGATYHNRPTGCEACHGNPAAGGSFDFPHTSTADRFLQDYPDALCIGCHTPGSLP